MYGKVSEKKSGVSGGLLILQISLGKNYGKNYGKFSKSRREIESYEVMRGPTGPGSVSYGSTKPLDQVRTDILNKSIFTTDIGSLKVLPQILW